MWLKPLVRRFCVVAWFFNAVVFGEWSVAKGQEEPAKATAEKATWREKYVDSLGMYASRSPDLWFHGGLDGKSRKVKAKLIITAVEGDSENPADDAPPRFNHGMSSHGCQISTEGEAGYFYRSSMGTKGSGYPTIPETKFKQLGEMLERLPDDGGKLPPAGRRLILQIASGERFRPRIYDRANLPNEILELLRLTGSGIQTWVPMFKADTQWSAHDHIQGGILCLTPDGKQIIISSAYGGLRFWEPDTQRIRNVVEVARSSTVNRIAFSPDGALAAVEAFGSIYFFDASTWERLPPRIQHRGPGGVQYLFGRPSFLPDGSLVVESRSEGIKLYDKELKLITSESVPTNAVTYAAAPLGDRAVLTDEANSLRLWDARQSRVVAKLADDCRARLAAFSPDESYVAVATANQDAMGYWSADRLRMWRTDDGELVHEFTPFGQTQTGPIEGLCWTPDGKYVLAATASHQCFTSRGIGVWSVKSGRHRGEFVGPSMNLTGMALLPDGKRLVAGDRLGNIRIWDFEKAMKTISDLEASLGEAN